MRLSPTSTCFLALFPLFTACSSAGSPTTSPTPSGGPSSDSTNFALHRRLFLPKQQIDARAPWSHAGTVGALDFVPAQTPSPPHLGDELGKFPAFTPNAPQLVENGGPTLSAPRVVTITWDGDPGREDYELFGDQLGDSKYWESVKEWGVGKAVAGPVVHMPAPFPAMDDASIDAFVQTNVDNAPSSGWPAYTSQTIYTMYIPAGAPFTIGGQPACQVAGGYHANTIQPAPEGGAPLPSVTYAVVLNCGFADGVLQAASHELAEASTDPVPFTSLALAGFDGGHFAYEIYQALQDEVGDACEFFANSFEEEPPPFTFPVQRPWSNKSAAEGHDPCIPRPRGEAYFNTTTFASSMDAISVDLSAAGYGPPIPTQGFKVPIGSSRTFDIGFYSDGPTADWTVNAVVRDTLPIVDANGNPVPNGSIQVSIDQPTGKNGHKARVTVTPLGTSAEFAAQYFELQSGAGQFIEAHTLPILVSQQ
jgi:hypothetical protein